MVVVILNEKLTEKQKKFCDYYIETGVGTESARLAGYKAKDLNVIACENLTKPYLKKYIQDKLAQKDNNRIASQDEVLQLLTSIARGELTEEVVCPDGVGGTFRANKDTFVKDRMKAAELLGKRYRLFDGNMNINSNQPIVINIKSTDDCEEDE